jgi:hypothetical protein
VTPVASFADVLQIVVGVLCSLAGSGLVLMGVLALGRRRWRGGAVGAAVGLVCFLVGLWLVGVL